MRERNFSIDSDTRRERIAARAHEIWEQAGRPEGESLTHWLQAEAELSSPASQPQAASAGRARAPKRRTADMAARS